MNKLILLIILATFFLLPSAYANIVDELTKLNNLYKDGALNQEEFNKAKKILEELDKAAKEGKGAAQLDGRMIDAASARMAENIVNIDKLIQNK